MHIQGEDGELSGSYRGRYRVRDRALPPEVAFSFQGEGKDTAAVLVWEGAGSSKGELRLRLLTPETMEVEWHATRLSGPSSLVSGTAVLIRRR